MDKYLNKPVAFHASITYKLIKTGVGVNCNIRNCRKISDTS